MGTIKSPDASAPGEPAVVLVTGVMGLALVGAGLWEVLRERHGFEPLMLVPLGLGAFASGNLARWWVDTRKARRSS